MSSSKSIDGGTIASKFDTFTIIDVEYKNVHGTPIPASILIPKDAQPGKYAVAVRWHGGGLCTGHRLFADWYADWNLAHYRQQPTIAIAPDYRLMPEANGVEILQDSKDFYTWLLTPGALASHLPDAIVPDLDNLLITGESAGGWHALQSAFLLPPSNPPAAIIAHYPMIDMRSPHYTQAYHKDILSPPIPQKDPAVLRAHVADVRGGRSPGVVTSREGEAGHDLVATMAQQGLYPEFFGTESELYPLERLDHAAAGSFPPLWILHGKKDSMVPVEGSEKFVEKLRGKFPNGALHVTFVEGEEHGFDLFQAASGAPATLQTEWVGAGLDFIGKYWP